MAKKNAEKVDQEQKTLQQLQNDYFQWCAKAGEAQYVISTKREELKGFFGQIRKINLKAHKMMEHQKTKATPIAIATPETTETAPS